MQNDVFNHDQEFYAPPQSLIIELEQNNLELNDLSYLDVKPI